MEELSLVGTGFTVAQGILQFLGYIKSIASSDVISGYFNWNGEQIEGNENIVIERHPGEDPAAWFFSVKPIQDYTFVRIPVTPSGIRELLGKPVEDSNFDSRYWRWVALPKPNVLVGGNYTPPKCEGGFHHCGI